jgi:hypothetical protein
MPVCLPAYDWVPACPVACLPLSPFANASFALFFGSCFALCQPATSELHSPLPPRQPYIFFFLPVVPAKLAYIREQDVPLAVLSRDVAQAQCTT